MPTASRMPRVRSHSQGSRADGMNERVIDSLTCMLLPFPSGLFFFPFYSFRALCKGKVMQMLSSRVEGFGSGFGGGVCCASLFVKQWVRQGVLCRALFSCQGTSRRHCQFATKQNTKQAQVAQKRETAGI